jgi:N-acetyl-beta-hexosaminidase
MQPRRTSRAVPVLATYFTVRRGRDPFFKFYMKTLFPRQVRQYSEKYGIRFIGWYNVAHGWDFDNVILFELPSYGVLDEMERDTGIQSIAHRGSEWMMERHHSMFLRERMGPELKIHL